MFKEFKIFNDTRVVYVNKELADEYERKCGNLSPLTPHRAEYLAHIKGGDESTSEKELAEMIEDSMREAIDVQEVMPDIIDAVGNLPVMDNGENRWVENLEVVVNINEMEIGIDMAQYVEQSKKAGHDLSGEEIKEILKEYGLRNPTRTRPPMRPSFK